MSAFFASFPVKSSISSPLIYDNGHGCTYQPCIGAEKQCSGVDSSINLEKKHISAALRDTEYASQRAGTNQAKFH